MSECVSEFLKQRRILLTLLGLTSELNNDISKLSSGQIMLIIMKMITPINRTINGIYLEYEC